MADNKKIVIYHLYRHDDTSLFLHPFADSDKSLDYFENVEIIGKYGIEPRVEAFTMFRNELYRVIEDRVNSWVSEVRFLPKFLISAGVFLFSYLFFALVVRDPLPLIDELAIGVGISLIVFFLLGRRDRRSDLSLKKRVALRSVVDKIVFREDPFIKEVESALQSIETVDQNDMVEKMFNPLKTPLTEEEKEDAERLTKYLKKRFKSRELKRKEKMVSRLPKSKEGGRSSKILSLLMENKKTDLPLFAVYTRIKKSFERVDS